MGLVKDRNGMDLTEAEDIKKRYKHLNAEFQRIARRDKKAFFSNQCKEIEENNRLGKTRDLFKKIRDTEGTFHAKMSLSPSSILAWRIPWTEKPSRLQSTGRKESDTTERLHHPP